MLKRRVVSLNRYLGRHGDRAAGIGKAARLLPRPPLGTAPAWPGHRAPPPPSTVTPVTSSLVQLCKTMMFVLDPAQVLTYCLSHVTLSAARGGPEAAVAPDSSRG